MPENITKYGYSSSAVCVAVITAIIGLVSLWAEMIAYAVNAEQGAFSYAIISLAFAIISLVTVSPVVFGVKRRMLLAYQATDTDAFEMFYLFGTKHFFRYVLLKTIIYLRAFLFSLVPFCIARACFIIKGTGAVTLPDATLSIAGIGFAVLGGLIFALSLAKAFMCDYLFTHNEKLGVFKVLHASSKLMRGRAFALAFLIVRLSPLYLACLTIVVIPFVYPLILRKTTEFSLTVIGGQI